MYFFPVCFILLICSSTDVKSESSLMFGLRGLEYLLMISLFMARVRATSTSG